jgi:hypothetical protein
MKILTFSFFMVFLSKADSEAVLQHFSRTDIQLRGQFSQTGFSSQLGNGGGYALGEITGHQYSTLSTLLVNRNPELFGKHLWKSDSPYSSYCTGGPALVRGAAHRAVMLADGESERVSIGLAIRNSRSWEQCSADDEVAAVPRGNYFPSLRRVH